jgi:elongation factor Tu
MENEQNSEKQAFLMPIDSVFNVTGRGTIVTGCVKSGVIRKGDELEIVGFNKTKKTVAVQVEKFRQLLDEAKAGDNIGVQLRGVKKEDITPGQVLATPRTAVAHSKFEAKCLISAEKEGGIPVCHKALLQFGFNTAKVTGQILLPDGADKVMPKNSADVTVELIYPLVMEEGTGFPIFKGNKKIATGVISKILK